MVRTAVQALKHLHKQGVRICRDVTSRLGSGPGLLIPLGSPTDGACCGLILTNPGTSSLGRLSEAFQARGRPRDLSELVRTGV